MKVLSRGNELNTKILDGVNKLADVVASTMGPRGRNVILQEKGKRPIITKDGVSVARFVSFDDPVENLGAQVIKQAAETTVNMAGDGTTTATVLARAILVKAQSYMAAGDSPIELKKGIELAAKKIIASVKDGVKDVSSLEQIEQIATISANGEKSIGKLISIAVDKVGRDGAITIQEGRSSETVLDVSEGFSFDSGILANTFINDERRGVCRYEDCLVMVTDRAVTTIDEILPVLEIVARDGRPFVIIAEQIEGQALAALVMNAAKGTMKIAAIKAPRYGEERRNILEDLSIITGATFISRESGLQFRQLKLNNFGTAKIVETSKVSTTIVSTGQHQSKTEERINSLKLALQNTSSMNESVKLQDRITRLASGIAIIKVGGSSEIEMIERKHRIEDALEAVNAAQSEGIIPGSSCAFIKNLHSLDGLETENEEQRHGVEILRQAVKEPFRKIVENAGMSPDVCLLNVLESSPEKGYNVATGEFVDLFQNGIIDPFKVLRCALENAVSVATTLLSTTAAVVEI